MNDSLKIAFWRPASGKAGQGAVFPVKRGEARQRLAAVARRTRPEEHP